MPSLPHPTEARPCLFLCCLPATEQKPLKLRSTYHLPPLTGIHKPFQPTSWESMPSNMTEALQFSPIVYHSPISLLRYFPYRSSKPFVLPKNPSFQRKSSFPVLNQGGRGRKRKRGVIEERGGSVTMHTNSYTHAHMNTQTHVASLKTPGKSMSFHNVKIC